MVIGRLADYLQEKGCAGSEKSGYSLKKTEDISIIFTIRTVTGKLPASVVQLDVDAALRSAAVAELCSNLVCRSPGLPTIWGPLGRLIGRGDYVSSYRFDWCVDFDGQFSKLTRDLDVFLELYGSIQGYRDLDMEKLLKVPTFRKLFSDGIGEVYRFGLPEIAAVVHKMNDNGNRALQALEIAEADKSGRLSAEGKVRLHQFVIAAASQ